MTSSGITLLSNCTCKVITSWCLKLRQPAKLRCRSLLMNHLLQNVAERLRGNLPFEETNPDARRQRVIAERWLQQATRF